MENREREGEEKMSSASVRNLAVMIWAMSFIKGIDQEDPQTILFIRLAFAFYTLFCLLLNVYLHMLIVKKADQTVIEVPARAASPFAPIPPPEEDTDKKDKQGEKRKRKQEPPSLTSSLTTPPKMERRTTMDYDLSILSNSRFSWITNAVVLTFIHFKMGTVAPMLMSGIMGLNRYFDDPLVNLYILGKPATGELKRPFGVDKGPLMGLMKKFFGLGDEQEGKDEEEEDDDDDDEGAGGRRRRLQKEELGGSSEEEDEDDESGEESEIESVMDSKREEDDLDGVVDATESKKTK